MLRLRSFAWITVLAAAFGALAAPAASAGEKKLINFASYPRDPGQENPSSKPYEYTYGSWGDKHTLEIRGKGTLVKSTGGNGGLGENRTALRLDGYKSLDLVFVIGNGNQAKSIGCSFDDADGTNIGWSIDLTKLPAGREVRFHLDLATPGYTGKPGKTAGFNAKKLSSWGLSADDKDPGPVEILLVGLVGTK